MRVPASKLILLKNETAAHCAAVLVKGWNCECVLSRFPSGPFPQVQVLLNLPAFVTMLQGFLWLVVNFPEGMFGVTNGFADYFQRFGHTLISFVQVKPGEKDANGLYLD
jgi:hypothetical protein